MQVNVLIEPMSGNGYRARCGEPFVCTVEGPTREAALQTLSELLSKQVTPGAELVPVEIPVAQHPLAQFAGMYKDDPLFDEWQQTIEELRTSATDEASP